MSKEASQSYSANNWAFWNSDVLEHEQDKKNDPMVVASRLHVWSAEY